MHIPKKIIATVQQWTGMPVSVGIAPTKTLAKVANRLAKKDKAATECIQMLLTPTSQQAALQATRVNEIWGIGSANANKLLNLGITSAWDLRNMPEAWAAKELGGVVGVRLIRELQGTPAMGMKKELLDKQMITTTRMFGKPVGSLDEVREAVSTYISRAAEKLRRQHSAASEISVLLIPREADDYQQKQVSPRTTNRARLPVASCITQDLIKAAMPILDSLFEPGRQYKKAGVILSGLVPEASVQGNLFGQTPGNQSRQLMNAVDNINFSMRDDVLKFGSSGLKKNWKMRQELRSARFTTRWQELPRVR